MAEPILTVDSEESTKHHDGFGLAEAIKLTMSGKDVVAGNGRHVFTAEIDGVRVMDIQFQHGPRHVQGSKSGIIDSVLLAVLIERYEAFQSGQYHCTENDAVLGHLRQAMEMVKARAKERASRDVLGQYAK